MASGFYVFGVVTHGCGAVTSLVLRYIYRERIEGTRPNDTKAHSTRRICGIGMTCVVGRSPAGKLTSALIVRVLER